MNMSLFIYNVNVIGHQDGFQFFTFVNSGAMNILVNMSDVCLNRVLLAYT